MFLFFFFSFFFKKKKNFFKSYFLMIVIFLLILISNLVTVFFVCFYDVKFLFLIDILYIYIRLVNPVHQIVRASEAL
jgi:hypothetical protein